MTSRELFNSYRGGVSQLEVGLRRRQRISNPDPRTPVKNDSAR